MHHHCGHRRCHHHHHHHYHMVHQHHLNHHPHFHHQVHHQQNHHHHYHYSHSYAISVHNHSSPLGFMSSNFYGHLYVTTFISVIIGSFICFYRNLGAFRINWDQLGPESATTCIIIADIDIIIIIIQ